jgi:hypothetical protein
MHCWARPGPAREQPRASATQAGTEGAMASTVDDLNKKCQWKRIFKRYAEAARRAGLPVMRASGGSGNRNEHVTGMAARLHSRKIMPLLMEEIENDNMCSASELRKFYANVKVTTLNKPDKQDPTAPPRDMRPTGSGEPPHWHKISQNPMQGSSIRALRSDASLGRLLG